MLFEESAEVINGFKAENFGNLAYRALIVGKQSLRPLKPKIILILQRRKPRLIFKRTEKLRLT